MNLANLILVLTFALLVPRVTAETPPAEQERGPAFRISSWGEWQGPELFVQNGKDWKSVELIDLGYSPPMTFSREQPIVLARKTIVKGDEKFVPFVTVNIPDGVASPLILLVPETKETARSFVVDIAPSAFPWGSYQFVNFTRQNFDSQVGNEKFQLQSSKCHVVNPNRTENTRLPILVRELAGTTATTVYSTMVINRPSKRMLVFFHPKNGPDGEKSIEARCLVDFRQGEGI